MVQKFSETAENQMNVNFRDKNFVIAPIFRDSRCDTPTIKNVPNFRDPKSNHENHKNIVPRKFGAIRYVRIWDKFRKVTKNRYSAHEHDVGM